MTRTLSAVIALLIACAASATATAGEAPMRIGLVLAGSATDGGWNQLAKDGADHLARTMTAEVRVVQKVAQDKAGDELRAFAADGYQLVIAHGYEYLNPAAEAAKGSATRFAVSGADVARAGIATIDFDVSQASYQIGIIAATLTTTGRIGYIGGAPFPSVKACLRGYAAGARSVRPDIAVIDAYTGWDDVEKNKSQAEAFIKQGIDQIYANVDAASRGVFEAVKERNTRRTRDAGPMIHAYGCVGDHNANAAAGPWIPASATIRFENAFLRLAASVRDGGFKDGVQREDIATGTCVITLNPKLMGTVLTPELVGKVEAAGLKLAAGEIAIARE